MRKAKTWLENKRKGFTLVELIIVIAIVAILTAVGIPAVASYVNKAVQAGVDSKAKLIALEGQAVLADAERAGTAIPPSPKLNDDAGTAISVGTLDKSDPLVIAFCKSAKISFADPGVSVTVVIEEINENGTPLGYSISKVEFTKGETVGVFNRAS